MIFGKYRNDGVQVKYTYLRIYLTADYVKNIKTFFEVTRIYNFEMGGIFKFYLHKNLSVCIKVWKIIKS